MQDGWYARMRPIMVASKFGLSAPYFCDKNSIWRVSWPFAIFGTLVQLLCISINIYTGYRVTDVPISSSPFLALSLSHFVLMKLYTIFLTVNTFFSYSKLAQCLNDFNKFSRKLPSEANHQFFLKRLNWLQVFVSMPLLVLLFGHKIFDGFQNYQYYILCAVIFFINILETFPAYYLVIVEGFAVSLQKRIKDFSLLPKGIIKIMPIMLKGKTNLIVGAKTNLYEELREAHKLYRQIWELKTKLNKTFSLQLFLTISHSFLQVIFYAFLNTVINSNWETAKQFMSFNDILVIKLWTFYVIWKIVWMVAVCHKVASSFKLTGPILHGIWREVENRNERDEFMGFSQELKHLRPDITAFGFFDINLSLIISMASACVMYFLILIQADFSGGANKNQAIRHLTFFGI